MNEFLDFGALRRMMVDTIILHARMTARLSAVLARLASKVYSVEIIEKLALSVQRRLAEQERDNVEVKVGDRSVSGGRSTFPSTGDPRRRFPAYPDCTACSACTRRPHGEPDVYGEQAVVQRCQVHKMRNVLAHLPEYRHAKVARCLREAHRLPFGGARRAAPPPLGAFVRARAPWCRRLGA